ncbi:MAG: YbaB/EbfC family nucleoid-associated protein [Chthonomonadales bacterium]|nr:YbaB/EbfC family nucleoid-associated protein [Chthonomonadales bacterium]
MGKGFGGRGGFGGMGDIAKLMKQAQKVQEDMLEAQEALQEERVEATSGGGAVKAIVNGKGRLVSVEIKPEAVDPEDVEMLQDLLVTAIREAEEKAEEVELERMKGLTGGMGLPPGLF